MAVNMTEHYQQEFERQVSGVEACGRQITRDARKLLTIFGMETELQILISVSPNELTTMQVIADGLPDEELWPNSNKRDAPERSIPPLPVKVNETIISHVD